MKKGLLFLIVAAALVGCSKHEGTPTTETALTNEAAGAANSNAPSLQTPPTLPGLQTNTTNEATSLPKPITP